MATVNGTAGLLAGARLTAAGTVTFTVRLSAAAAVHPTARLVRPGTAAFSAPASMTVNGFVPLLTARPSLSAVAKVTQPGAAALHAPGTLTAATSQSVAHLAAAPKLLAPGRNGAARLSAGTSLTVSGQYFMPGASALLSAPVLSASGKVTSTAAVSLRASTALAAAALVRISGSAPLSAPASLTAGTLPVCRQPGRRPGAGRLRGRTRRRGPPPCTPRGLRALPPYHGESRSGSPRLGGAVVSGVVSRAATAALRAPGTISAAGTVHARQLAAGALQASAVLRAAGIQGRHGAATLASAAALSARALRSAAGHAALAAAASAAVSGQVTPGAHLHASASLSAAALASRAGRTALAGGARLTAAARGTALPAAALKAPGVLVPAPTGVAKGTTAFACSPSLAARADTRPKVPFPVRSKGQQPTWQRTIQRFAVVQERQRHAQALWQYGELSRLRADVAAPGHRPRAGAAVHPLLLPPPGDQRPGAGDRPAARLADGAATRRRSAPRTGRAASTAAPCATAPR